MTTTPFSQEQINRAAWQACDTFRGGVDPTEYKNYILVMLFIKYLSDMHRDRMEELRVLSHCQVHFEKS